MPAAQTSLVIGGGIAGPVAATALTMAGLTFLPTAQAGGFQPALGGLEQ
jgi:predicted NAD/FAD-dependent oxidoreductase